MNLIHTQMKLFLVGLLLLGGAFLGWPQTSLLAAELVVGIIEQSNHSPNAIDENASESGNEIIDAWSSIALRANVDYRYKPFPAKRLPLELSQGTIDIALSVPESELAHVSFLENPLYTQLFGIWQRQNEDPLESLEELTQANGEVAVQLGVNSISRRLKKLDSDFEFFTIHNPDQIVRLLAKGRIRYFYSTYRTIKLLSRKEPYRPLKLVFNEVDEKEYYIAVHIGTAQGEQLYEKLQNAQNDLLMEGILPELYF